MAQAASEFPTRTHFGHHSLEFAYLSYEVKKTNSMVNPIVGYLNFTEINGPDLQYVFHWQVDHWVFDRMLCRNNGMDLTELPAGIEIMNGGEMRPFLARYGRAMPEPVQVLPRPPAITPPPTPVPGAWMWENRNNPLEQRPTPGQGQSRLNQSQSQYQYRR